MRSHGTPSAAVAIQAGRIRAVASQVSRNLAAVTAHQGTVRRLRAPGTAVHRAGAGRKALGEVQAVVVNQAPRRRKVGESKVPSAARRKGVVRRWRVIVGNQAAKARPHNPRREVVAVAVFPVVAAVAAVAAAAEEDKEVRTCIPTHGKTKSGY
jgi:hypothetical protein